MDRWLGKTAVVTGAGSGIGEAITCALLRNGLNVAALDIEKVRLAMLDEKCKRDRTLGKLYPICCDVTIEKEIDKAFSTVETLWGGMDIMVNCAGIIYFSRIIVSIAENYSNRLNTLWSFSVEDIAEKGGDSDRKTFEKLLNTNVLTYAVCMNKAVRSMRQRNVEGHIFNISSVLAHINPMQGMSEKDDYNGYNVYPASKHAARVITTAVRREIAAVQASIRVTNISPGSVKTNITKNMKEFHDLFDKISCIQPEDVANALVYVLGTRPEVQITELTIQPTLEML